MKASRDVLIDLAVNAMREAPPKATQHYVAGKVADAILAYEAMLALNAMGKRARDEMLSEWHV